jgi:hypothetical protein
MSNVSWALNPSLVNPPTSSDPSIEHSESPNEINLNDQPTSAPQGYWAGFSPPTSPRMDEDGNHLPQGEDDYWASYGKSFTPGGVTPAVQQSPGVSRRSTQADVGVEENTSPRKGSKGLGLGRIPEKNPNSNSEQGNGHGEGLLRSRIEMKIASTLRKLWIAYLPSSDPEVRALTFLSLGRAVQSSGSSISPPGGEGEDHEGTKGKMEMLYEVYQVVEEDTEGFYRLVEKSLTSPGSLDGFGIGNRQDSSAQLNYWE